MYFKPLVALAAASLVGQAVASPHQHGLQHAHHKRARVTELVTVTDWVTVTVVDGETSTSVSKVFYTRSRKFKNRPSSFKTTTSSTPALAAPSLVVPTTVTTEVKPTSTVPEQNTPPVAVAVPPSSSLSEVANTPAPAPAPTPTPAAPAPSSAAEPPQPPQPTSSAVAETGGGNAQSGSDGSNHNAGSNNGNSNAGNNNSGGTAGASGKRGLAYNEPQFLQRFLSSGTKISWTYNWGQYDDSGTSLEFCPMLWGLKLDFAQTWPKNAQKAIDAGSKCLFSFNEPDLDAQANLSPQVAAEKHIELMNPFKGKALIGSPAITNSGAAHQGIQWLKQWFSACGGKCAVDFVNIHIYGVDTNTFLAHLLNVHNTFQKPVWITEFAFGGSDGEINSQLETVIDQIETNSTFSFVERYAYFMAADGILVKGNSLSTYGNTFAYGA